MRRTPAGNPATGATALAPPPGGAGQEAFRPWCAGSYPAAERTSREVVRLQLSAAHTDADVDAVIAAL